MADVTRFERILRRLGEDGARCGDQRGGTEAAAQAEKKLKVDEGAASPLSDEEQLARELFDWGRPITISRAPGRLDLMGGIADYSGSLVLQMPIAEAAMVAVQRHAARDDVRVVSLGRSAAGRAPQFSIPLSQLRQGLAGSDAGFGALRSSIASCDGAEWAAYVVGALAVLLREGIGGFDTGVSMLVYSEVPEGKGVSSSAAVEVASMLGLLGSEGLSLSPPEKLALLCQRVENDVVGAPCGVMDQMASALGSKGQLLALLCRPAQACALAVQHTAVLPSVAIPSHVRVWGIDSGVRHSVGGSDYGSVRCATFMGKTLLRAALEGKKQIDHLTELTVEELEQLEHLLPTEMRGANFVKKHGGHGDSATIINPSVEYKVRVCTRHPICENARVSEFRALLAAPASKEQLRRLGALMLESHASYSAVGLGSDATDKLVAMVRTAGESSGLYGAKITGGGSGGTVSVLGDDSAAAEAAVTDILKKYNEETGRSPYVVIGSSVGALEFGKRVFSPISAP